MCLNDIEKRLEYLEQKVDLMSSIIKDLASVNKMLVEENKDKSCSCDQVVELKSGEFKTEEELILDEVNYVISKIKKNIENGYKSCKVSVNHTNEVKSVLGTFGYNIEFTYFSDYGKFDGEYLVVRW